MQWTASDLVFAGFILTGSGVIAELVVKTSGDWAYRIGAGLALLATVLLLWINAAGGLIGSGEPLPNLLYLAVIAVGFLGAVGSRFRAGGLSQSMVCAAAFRIAIGILAVEQGWGQGSGS